MSDCTQSLRKRIAQLEAELQAVRRQTESQRQRLAQKYGREFLVLIDDPNTKATVTDIVQKLVFQDEEGNVVSETDGSLVGKIIKMRFKSLH
ncbi:hypothetical protein [Chlorogloea sp. CCALA 695]|uniref:hypothetical protein n=1 Tax=Chlorogloea sp. CCALA 695 TaxID=2107693 RepID=UPI000D07FB67|nr:hypothetical protein [Chlorogloea sp. CCALA 695]PSB27730.1 hypothetical protein C7B70_21795 [Chlorogloea sp. CCALA 695]